METGGKTASCATLAQGISFLQDDLGDLVSRDDVPMEDKLQAAWLHAHTCMQSYLFIYIYAYHVHTWHSAPSVSLSL